MSKIIQVHATQNHILALDDAGNIYWRSWTKKGWGLMEQVPLPGPVPSAKPTPTPPSQGTQTAPIVVAPEIIAPVIPAVVAPVIPEVVISPPGGKDPA